MVKVRWTPTGWVIEEGADIIQLAWGRRLPARIPPLKTFGNWVRRRFPGAQVIEPKDYFAGCPSFGSPDLLPHQREAVSRFMATPHGGLLVRFDPGLGKTAVGLEILQYFGSALIIVPYRLRAFWMAEAAKKGITLEPPFTLVHYEALSRGKVNPPRGLELLILDESSLIRNRKAKRTQEVFRIFFRNPVPPKVLLLSALPAPKFLDGLWTQLRLLSPDYFTSYWRFVEEYCLVRETPWGTEIVGSRVDPEEEFSDLIYSVSWGDIEVPLGEVIREVLPVPLEGVQREAYEKARDEFLLLVGKEEVPIRTKMEWFWRLLEISSLWEGKSVKADLLLDLIQSGYLKPPFVVWVWWRRVGEFLSEMLSLPYLGGGEKEEVFEETLKALRREEVPGVILSLGVGKFGLNLPEVNSAVFFDLHPDLEALYQASYRPLRLSRGDRPLLELWLVSSPIERAVLSLLKRKALSLEEMAAVFEQALSLPWRELW